jgi:hypothetical protein
MAKVTKTSITLSVMTANGDKPMDKVVALIVKAQHKAGFLDVTDKIAAGAYRWAVNKGMAPGAAPARAAAPKTAKEKAVKRMVKEVVAKAAPKAKAAAVKSVTKSPEDIERIKAANMERMKSVLARTKQSVRNESTDEVSFGETDTFAAPAFLSKDEVTALV